MKCQRLKTLIRDWYQEVRNFTLSPIKMMELINKHVNMCEVCQNDEDLPLELDQLREILKVPYNLPSSEELKSKEEDEFNLEISEYLYEPTENIKDTEDIE